MNFSESIIKKISRSAVETGLFQLASVLKLTQNDVKSKGLNDFVSFVDKQSEAMLIEELSRIIPNSSFLAEESGEKHTNSEWTWIIDPLDGTTNYIHGIPLYSISIALMKENELFAGVVHEPNLNETFHAVKGEGAFLNGKPIQVTAISSMKDSLWATGFPYHDFDKIDEYMEFIKYSIKHTHGLRRLGSAAIDLVYTAAGRIDGFFEFGLNPWDVAAGALIVQEAGGVVSDFSGNNGFVFNKEIIACNPALYKEFFEKFREIYF
ncbi:Inositol-1-monophosphatase [bioreactor metagenome]|uniref:inositol-phosphate phosphatase n=1 Tax=bioreactor metagenome TaxID=1076179 RepID=A0A644WPQ9_9ZZZZ